MRVPRTRATTPASLASVPASGSASGPASMDLTSMDLAVKKQFDALLPSMKKEFMDMLASELARLMSEAMQTYSPAPQQTNVERHLLVGTPGIVRYKLYEQSDKILATQLGKDMVPMLHDAGHPFTEIYDAQHRNPHDNTIVFILYSEEAEPAIRERSLEIRKILGFSRLCGVTPPQYYVQVQGIVPRALPRKPHHLIDDWSIMNDVSISAGFVTYGKVVLMLLKLDEARKLVKGGLKLSRDQHCHVTPFNRRSTPKFCFNCHKPNHLRAQCRADRPSCGRCAADHDTRACDERSPPKCVNCEGEHEAWSQNCKSVPVRKMKKECKKWELQEPSWASTPPTPPQQEASGQAKKSGQIKKSGQAKKPGKSSTRGTKARGTQSQDEQAETQEVRRGPARGCKNITFTPPVSSL